MYIAPFGYDIVVYTAAYIRPVVSAAIFAFSSHTYLFPPSFMHAATATRPLALITSQPTTNDYTVVSIGVVLSLVVFFCMAASANLRIWNPRIFCLAFRILVVVPSPYAYIQKKQNKIYCCVCGSQQQGIEPTRDFGIWHQIFPTTFSSKFSSCSVESLHLQNSLLCVESKSLDLSFVSFSDL